MSTAAKPRLDRIDWRIVATLQADGRISNRRLAELVHLSPSACLERTRRLEEAGVVGPYLAIADLSGVCPTVAVLATATLRDHHEAGFAAFERAVAATPEIVECFKLGGPHDYVLRFVCADLAHYHAASDELLRAARCRLQLTSHVVLKEVKPFRGLPFERLAGG